FFFQAEDGIRDFHVTGVQTCALPIYAVYVVYDDEGGGWAGRFIWLLDVIGHSRSHFLNGGLQAWMSEGRELSQASPAAATGQIKIGRASCREGRERPVERGRAEERRV